MNITLNLTDLITLGLVLYLVITQIKKPKKEPEKPTQMSEEQQRRKEAIQKEFDGLMDYSINDAIESKKVNN